MSKETVNVLKNNPTVKRILYLYWHIYALLFVAGFALFTRVQGIASIRSESGSFIFLSDDPWYHYRATSYTVENWPYLMDVDPLSGYPIGSKASMFGQFYDFVHATIALILGLGSPSDDLVRTTLVFSSPILTVFILFAVYYISFYITKSRLTSVLSSIVLTFIPGTFYVVGNAGFASRHIFEVLLLLLMLLSIMKSIDIAEKKVITISVLKERDFGILSPWFKMATLSGILLLFYYFTWTPAIFIVGLVALSFVVYTIISFEKFITIEPFGLTLTYILSFGLVGTIIQNPQMNFELGTVSIVHVFISIISLLLVVACLAAEKQGYRSEWSRTKFTGIFSLISIMIVAILYILSPDLISTIYDSIYRLLGFGSSYESPIIPGERTFLEMSFEIYGLTLLAAMIGLLFIFIEVYKDILRNRPCGGRLLFITVSASILIFGIRSNQFDHYIAPFVAVLSAIVVKEIINFTDTPRRIGDIKGYHILSIALVAFIFLPILLIPMGGSMVVYDTEIGQMDNQAYEDINEPLEWLSNNSPDPGIDKFESHETVPVKYSEESYGVMSWSGYGHFITTIGERPSVATTYGDNEEAVAEYLLSTNVTDAEDTIDELNDNMKVDTRYLLIDWEMADENRLFADLVDSTGEDLDEYANPYMTPTDQVQELAFTQRTQSYYETIVSRLYNAHGSQIDSSKMAVDYTSESTEDGEQINIVRDFEDPIKTFNSTEEAENFTSENPETELGGIGKNPPEKVDALNTHRLVKSSGSEIWDNPAAATTPSILNEFSDGGLLPTDIMDNPATSKLFERVPGAEIQSTNAPESATIEFSVNMFDPDTGSTFTYTKNVETDEDGNLNATLPYSTTGYDENEMAPEVRATGPYTVTEIDGSAQTTVEVNEEKVVQEESDEIYITL